MDESEKSQNPYEPPLTEKLSTSTRNRELAFNGFVWLFVVPFVLAHMVFWPLLLLFIQTPAPRGDYGVGAALNALALVTATGFSYGIFVGRFRAGKDWGISLLYGLGESFLFPVSVVTPCTIFLLAA